VLPGYRGSSTASPYPWRPGKGAPGRVAEQYDIPRQLTALGVVRDLLQPGKRDHLIHPPARDPVCQREPQQVLERDQPGCSDRASSSAPTSCSGAG
jgi:hypothetical protein